MKILTICHGLGVGGTERAAQDFTLGFRTAGHEVAFLNYGVTGPRGTILGRSDVPVYSANGDLDGAVAKARDFAPDIIHIHRRGRRNDLETAILKELKSKKNRVLEHNVFGDVDYSVGSEFIDVHLHLSKWCFWRWRRFFGWNGCQAPAAVIGNPVMGTDFYKVDKGRVRTFLDSIGIEEGAYVCGRVGQPNTGKWHPALIGAFTALLDYAPSAYLLLIGISPEIEDAIRALPSIVRDRVRVMPMTADDAELRCFYSSLDCFIHAARLGESFGLVLAEAMLCGCPVVTVNQPHKDNSQVEVVGHLRGGIVAGSIRQLNSAVKAIYVNRELRNSISLQCRDNVLIRFESGVLTQKVLRVAEIALGAGDRQVMLRELSADHTLITEVSDDEAKSLNSNLFGEVSRKELILMHIFHNKYINLCKNSARRCIKREI